MKHLYIHTQYFVYLVFLVFATSRDADRRSLGARLECTVRYGHPYDSGANL
jgi:hypothetical protein